MQQSSLRQRLSGVFTALVTPMQDGALDLSAFERHVAAQLDAGIHGLVPVGTTGEAATLSRAEIAQLIGSTVALAGGNAFVMAGVGSNSTTTTIDNARHAADLGVDGLLVVTPYYNKPSQNGLFDHFAAVAAAVDLPITLYSVPGRTGVELAAPTAARLAAACPNIVSIKEAGGRCERVSELRLACGADFVVHSGDDALTLPFLALGAAGVISVASNLLPREMVRLYDAWQAGDCALALRLHEGIYDLLRHLFIESNPVPVKAALAAAGLMSAEVRAPLGALTTDSQAALRQSLTRFEEWRGVSEQP
ncbi:MAG: dihydrodipicolinate synthase [Proteobacteria bacterium]|nr:dihydrodipicolinate synthase [Pseudomonadota bacterium]